MNDTTLSPTKTYRLKLPESPDVALDVVDVVIDDALDELFRVEVAVHTTSAELSPRDYVGRHLALDVPSLSGTLKIRAIIASMRQELAEPTGISRYRLVAVPALWLTRQRKNSRIFQGQSVVTMIHAITADYGERIPACPTELSVTPPEREYIAQYGESDWDMIHRSAADYGIALAALHDGSGKVLLSDDLGSVGARAGEAVPFRPLSDLTPEEPHVLAAVFESQLTPSGAHVRDYDYARPKLPLDGRALDADAFASELALETFEFAVGKFDDESTGGERAQSRLQEGRRERERAIFQTSLPAAPGTLFTLADHPRADANIEWLVVASTTRATHTTARHEVIAIPAAQRYRPSRRPAPRVIGTQTAVVVGPDTEEIDVDAEARVCVRFRWDRRDKTADTTRRVRVSQAWAGPGYGFVCIPRIGDEVVVDFLDGDPDRPIIVGRVFNGINPPPQKLPEQKAWSTWRSRSTPGGEGFNEITLDDAAGDERIYVHAQKDAIVEVENDVHAHVKGNVNGLVRGNGTGGVKGTGKLSIDGDASLSVGGDLAIDVDGSINASAGANIALSAGDQRRDESTNHFIETGGLWITASSAVQVNTAHFHVFAGDIKLQAGGSVIEITSGGINIKSGGDVVVNGAVIKLN